MKRILFVLLVLSSILLFGCSNNVSVNFMVNDEVISTIEIKNGEKIIEPEKPELEGHGFDGWYYNNKKWDFDKDVSSSDITLVAKFSPKEYTITIDKDNGEDVEQKTFKYGETVMIDVPLKSGYIFNGWDQELPSEMPSKDLSIKALWVSLIDAKLQFEDKLFINEEKLLKVTDANGEKELGNITFKSTDNDIAYVSGNKVIGIASGSCKIQAIYNYNVILEKTIYVIDKAEQKKIEEAAIGLILPSDQFEEDILLPNKVASLYSVKWEIEDNDHCEVLYANQTTQYLKILENYEWSNGLKLTATIYGVNEGVQAQKVFTIYVRMSKVQSFTIKDIMESNELNIEVSLTGTVYYVCPQGFWLTDETGYTIYVYGSDVAKNVKQGDKVKVTGTKILYYSMFEIEKSTVEVLEEGNGAFDLSSMIKDNTIDVISTYEKKYRYEYGRIYRIQGEVIEDPTGRYTYGIRDILTEKYVVFYDSAMNDANATKANLQENLGKYVKVDVMVWDHYSSGFVRVLPISEVSEAVIPDYSYTVNEITIAHLRSNMSEYADNGKKLKMTVRIIRFNGDNIYIEDVEKTDNDETGSYDTAGIYLYAGYGKAFSAYSVGTILTLECQCVNNSTYGFQLTNPMNVELVKIGSNIKDVEYRTYDGKTQVDLTKLEGLVVKFEKVTVKSVGYVKEDTGAYTIEVETECGQIINARIDGSTTPKLDPSTIEVGSEHVLIGGVSKYIDTYQVMICNQQKQGLKDFALIEAE